MKPNKGRSFERPFCFVRPFLPAVRLQSDVPLPILLRILQRLPSRTPSPARKTSPARSTKVDCTDIVTMNKPSFRRLAKGGFVFYRSFLLGAIVEVGFDLGAGGGRQQGHDHEGDAAEDKGGQQFIDAVQLPHHQRIR